MCVWAGVTVAEQVGQGCPISTGVLVGGKQSRVGVCTIIPLLSLKHTHTHTQTHQPALRKLLTHTATLFAPIFLPPPSLLF